MSCLDLKIPLTSDSPTTDLRNYDVLSVMVLMLFFSVSDNDTLSAAIFHHSNLRWLNSLQLSSTHNSDYFMNSRLETVAFCDESS